MFQIHSVVMLHKALWCGIGMIISKRNGFYKERQREKQENS